MQSEQLNTTRLLIEFKVLSFDGYGTLIDWETGILEGLGPLLARCGRPLTPDQVLTAHARLETAQEAETPGMLYPDLLARVHDRMALEWGVRPIEEESRAYGQSLQDWPVFLDSAAVLQYFQKYYKLVMISNVDNENFRRNQERLQVDFAWAFTAQDIGSYKPDLRNFEYMLRELGQAGFQKQDVLHVSESLFHDHVPANRMGLASAWINRRAGRPGTGANLIPEPLPHYDFRFTSLAAMAKTHQDELRAQV